MVKPAQTARTYVVRTRDQLAALASGVRQELADALAQMGDVSVAELAATLGRPADALYYHLRILRQAGLVRDAGRRVRQGRSEALFRTVAPELRIDSEGVRRDGGEPLVAVVGAMLRLGARDYRRALADPQTALSGPGRELVAMRRTAWLDADQLARLNEAVDVLAAPASGAPGRGRLYAVTVLLTPLQPRRRAAGGKTPAGSRRGSRKGPNT